MEEKKFYEVGQEQTGTGKTAAFGLATRNNILHNGDIEKPGTGDPYTWFLSS